MKQKKWTMRNALLVLCISSVVFALLLQTFLFHQSLRRQIRAESISDHEISLNKMQTDLSNFIHTIRGEMLTIYSEQDLINAMRDAAEQDSSMKEYYWRTWYMARKRFTKEDQVLAMYLYDTKDKLISSYRYNSVTYPRDIYKADYDDNEERVYSYVHGDRTDLMISGYHNPEAKKDIIRFVLKLHNYDADRSSLGYLVCDINSAAFTSIMAKYVDVEQVCLWLQPLDDKVIAMTGQASESQSRIQKQLSKVIQDYYQANELQEEYDGNYLIQVSQENYNLEAFVLVSQSLLTAAQKSLIRTLLIIMAAMIAAVAVLVLFVSQWVTRPVEEMSSTITRIKNGEKQLRVQPIGWSQELSTLGTEFNEMLDRMEVMAQEELQHKMLVERTEYKMLQAQINPHFLFNSLNAGAQLAMMGDADKTGIFLEKMADFFRYNVRKMEEDAMLWEEIEAVDNYIYILNVRFAGDIVYIREIDEDIENIRIPSMILQPLVENAVQHGIHDCMETGRIVMSIHRNQDMIDITVSDNGAGMTEEMIAKVMEGRAVQDEENRYSTGIAVHNVIERLKLYYKQEGLMTIESDGPGTGTKVHIVIPMEKEELE